MILILMPLSHLAYIKNEFQKLDMYKRIASIQNADEYGEMLDELIDRFGELPKPAANLLLVALIRAEAPCSRCCSVGA